MLQHFFSRGDPVGRPPGCRATHRAGRLTEQGDSPSRATHRAGRLTEQGDSPSRPYEGGLHQDGNRYSVTTVDKLMCVNEFILDNY